MAKKAKAGFYAVAKGRQIGVYETWKECEQNVRGFTAAVFKKFDSRLEADRFIRMSSGQLEEDESRDKAQPAPSQSSVSKASKRAHDDDDTVVTSSKRKKILDVVEDAGTLPPPIPGIRVIDIYTDGASSKNGHPDARAGWGVHFPEGADESSDLHGLDESARLPGPQTNNRAELMAIIRALQLCPSDDVQLRIFSDSRYCINAMSDWVHKWRLNGWSNSKGEEVKNRDMMEYLYQLLGQRKYPPKLIHVKGHSTIPGNIAADILAVAGAALPFEASQRWEHAIPPLPKARTGKAETLAKFGFKPSNQAPYQ